MLGTTAYRHRPVTFLPFRCGSPLTEGCIDGDSGGLKHRTTNLPVVSLDGFRWSTRFSICSVLTNAALSLIRLALLMRWPSRTCALTGCAATFVYWLNGLGNEVNYALVLDDSAADDDCSRLQVAEVRF